MFQIFPVKKIQISESTLNFFANFYFAPLILQVFDVIPQEKNEFKISQKPELRLRIFCFDNFSIEKFIYFSNFLTI